LTGQQGLKRLVTFRLVILNIAAAEARLLAAYSTWHKLSGRLRVSAAFVIIIMTVREAALA